MSLKSSLSQGLDAAYEAAQEKLDALFATAEVFLDEVLPDESLVSVESKRQALARFCEDKGYPEQASNYLTGVTPEVFVSIAYGLLCQVAPEYTDDSAPGPVDKEEAPKTPADYLAYLKKNFPTMAKVYAQTLIEQERANNVQHARETDDDEYTQPDEKF